MACSVSPHGSPASICSDQQQYTPYLSPSPSIHDIPSSSIPPPMSSDMSLPYSVDNGSMIYTSVPTTSAGYYSSMTPAHWISENGLPSFPAFQHEEQQISSYDGEIPVAVIDMRDGAHIEAEMNTQLNFYSPSPCSSPDSQHPMYYDMPTMVPPELAAGGLCSPYPTSKPTKSK